jgi:DNA (cytosine-5)-methyltransferase 1
MQPRLLDLFSAAGGAARGYQLAGFHVTGVDILPQPRYAGDHFCQADIMEVGLPALLRELGPFDAIHASPPCLLFTSLHRATQAAHIDLVTPLRPQLLAAGLPFVIENVPGAPLVNPVLLCGTMFGLRVRRHRLFELHPQPPLVLLPPCSCRGRVASGELIGHRVAGRVAAGRRMPPRYTEAERRAAIGVEWITARGARQAIPPAYTEFIGAALRRVLNTAEARA